MVTGQIYKAPTDIHSGVISSPSSQSTFSSSIVSNRNVFTGCVMKREWIGPMRDDDYTKFDTGNRIKPLLVLTLMQRIKNQE